jgi:two-component system, OmpR family, response regulator CpxR
VKPCKCPVSKTYKSLQKLFLGPARLPFVSDDASNSSCIDIASPETSVERILVVDDDRELCDMLRDYLVVECFEVDCVHNGNHGLEQAVSGKYDVVVLDVMLPGMPGTQVLQKIRATSRVGVMMLTARGEDVDRILGLEYGADDYLAKPFNPRELVARLRAVLRRLRPGESDSSWIPELLQVDDLYLDRGSRTCRLGGEIVNLTTTEFDLLVNLVKSSGRVVSRKDLVRMVLDREFSPFDRSIDVHISNLRKKLGALPEGAERIRSVRNIGYLYAHTQSAASQRSLVLQ